MTISCHNIPLCSADLPDDALSFFFSGIGNGPPHLQQDSSSEALARRGTGGPQRSLDILDSIEDAISMTLIGNNIVNIAASAFITYMATKAFMSERAGTAGGDRGGDDRVSHLLRSDAESHRAGPRRIIPHGLLVSDSGPHGRHEAGGQGLACCFRAPAENAARITAPEQHGIVRSREEIDISVQNRRGGGDHRRGAPACMSPRYLSFKDMTAGEIMTPTIDIISVELDQGIRGLSDVFVKTKFSQDPRVRGAGRQHHRLRVLPGRS